MKKIISLLFAITLSFGLLSAQNVNVVVGFEDITTGSGAVVPFRYSKFTWSNNVESIGVLQDGLYGLTSTPSGDYKVRAAPGAETHITTIGIDNTDASPLTAFNFSQIRLAGYNIGNSASSITITGTYTGGGTVTKTISSLSNSSFVLHKFTTLSNLVSVTLTATGNWMMDDFTYNVGADIDIQGNGSSILDEDTTPSTTDYTDFGETGISGSTFTRTFTIENIGSAALSLSGSPKVVVGGTHSGDFTVTTQPSSSSIAAGDDLTFVVTFDPSATGTRSATLSIANDDPDEGTYNFSIQGTGVSTSPEINVKQGSTNIADAGTFDFGAQSPSSYTDKTFTIENLGNASLSLSGSPIISLTGSGDYSVNAQPSSSTVASSGSTTFTIRFAPTSSGDKTGYIVIASNDGNENPYNITLTGSGSAPEMNLKQNSTNIGDNDSFNFGGIASGSSSDKTFDIENLGTIDLTLSGSPTIAITGSNNDQFSVESQPTSPISASGSSSFTIQFSPTSTGAKTATISIANNDGNENPYDITINGTGETPASEINIKNGSTNISDGGSCDFGIKTLNTNSDKVFTIENSGNINLTLSGSPIISIGGTNADQFSVEAQPDASVGLSGTSDFTIRFTPTSEGSKTATIEIANNDSNENPYNLTLTGEGSRNSFIYFDDITTETHASLTNGYNGFNWGGHITSDAQLNSYGWPGNSPSGEYQVRNDLDTIFITRSSGSSFSLKELQVAQYLSSATSLSIIGILSSGGTVTEIVPLTSKTYKKLTFSTFNSLSMLKMISNGEWLYDDFVYCMDKDINIKGNNTTIVDDDSTPSTVDDTDFGGQTVSSGSISKTFTIENIGGDTLNLTDSSPFVVISGTHANDFSLTQTPSDTILASGSTTFQITFDPSAMGSRNATISIANDDNDENPYDFDIKGTGLAPEINLKGNGNTIADNDTEAVLTDSTDFGSVNIPGGASLIRTFTIENIGTSDLVLTDSSPYVSISGHTSDFTLHQIPADTITASATTTFKIKFEPTTVGLRTAVLSIENNDSDETPYNFTIKGTGVAVADMVIEGNGLEILNADLIPSLADSTIFGNVNVDGDSIVHTFKIKNPGLASLSLSGNPIVAVSGHVSDFHIINAPANSVPANNDSTSFQISFNPTAGGLRSATLSIENNDPYDDPYTFGVGGTGFYLAPTVQASTILVSDTGAAQIEFNWINGNGSRRVVFMSQTTTGTPSPVDNSTYIANTHFKKGTQIESSGWYCISNGTEDSVIVNGLMPDTTYRFMVCEYNGEDGSEKYLTSESSDNIANQLTKNIMINEVDADTYSTDDQEFIELFDGGTGSTSLDGLVLVLYNGGFIPDATYNSFDLDGYTTDANGYFVIAGNGFTGSASIRFIDNNLQNGADAIALYADSSSNFTNGTLVTTSYLIDALVYDSNDGDDAGLLVLLSAGEQVNEDGNGDKDFHSNQRIPNGTGGLRNTSTYDQQRPTPGARNNALPTSANGNLAASEDVNKTLALTDFTYGDIDGDSIFQIQLTTKPTKGSLFIDLNDDGVIDASEELANNDTILRTEIVANKFKYRALSNEFSNAYTTFEFKVHDSLAYSESSYTTTINVAAVNDLPTAANDTVTTPEDTDKVFTASEFNYSDIEGSAMQQIQITLIPDDGILFNDANTDGVIDGGEELANNDIVTKAHINANRLKFKPDLNEFGSPYAHFNFKVHDGTAYSDSAYLLTIDVTPVNDLPTSSDDSFSTPINIDRVIMLDDFPFDDVEGSPITQVNIPAVPIKGYLYLDADDDNIVDGGEAYTDGANILKATIESAKVKYEPASNESGSPYTTFTFRVHDGTALSTDTYIMTINVYPEFVVGGITEDMIICHNSIPNKITGLAPTGGNTPYTYQWQNSSDGTNYTDISGATSLDYQPAVLSDTTYFRQIQTSASNCGTRITNIVTIYTLEEFIAGSITANQMLCYSSTPVKLVGTTPTGGKAPYSYQWQSSTDGTNFLDISGQTNLDYQPPLLTNTTYYRLLQTSSSGCDTLSTNIVTINIYDEFKVGSISGTQVTYYKNLPEKFIGRAPTGGAKLYTYQWQMSTDGTNFSNIYGTNKLDYQAGKLTHTTYFQLQQSSDSGCGTELTNKIVVVVFPELRGGSISADQHIVYNTIPEKLIGKKPYGGREPYSYQWQSSTDGISFTDIIGETSLDYQAGVLTEITYYQLIQSSSHNYADKATNIVTIHVYPEFKVGSISDDQIVCYNSAPDLLIGTEPTGGNEPYNYQWQQANDGINFIDIIGATALDYQAPVLIENTYYQQIQTSSTDCGNFTTNMVNMTIKEHPTVICMNDVTGICANENPQLSATAENYKSIIWTTSGDGSFSDVTILNPTYMPGFNDNVNGTVTLTLTANAETPCNVAFSDDIILTFTQTPIVDAGENLTIMENTQIQLNANVVGEGNYSYLWSPATLVLDPGILNPLTNPISETSTLTLQVTNNQTGCIAEDQVVFTVEAGVTYQISGKIETIGLKNSLPSTQIYFTAIDETTSTNDEGEYTMMVPSGYCGWSIPSRPGYVFDPDSIPFNNVGTDLTDQNYGGTLYMRAIASPDSITVGQSSQLSVELINSTNQITACSWIDENGEFCTEETATVSPTETTLYSVYIEDAFERAFDTVSVIVSSNVGIDDLLINEGQIKVYPNPTHGSIWINISNNSDADIISIFDLNGKLMKKTKLQNSEANPLEISLESLSKGSYIIMFINSKGEIIKRQKLIKI